MFFFSFRCDQDSYKSKQLGTVLEPEDDSDVLIEGKNVYKSFGDKDILRGVSFKVTFVRNWCVFSFYLMVLLLLAYILTTVMHSILTLDQHSCGKRRSLFCSQFNLWVILSYCFTASACGLPIAPNNVKEITVTTGFCWAKAFHVRL